MLRHVVAGLVLGRIQLSMNLGLEMWLPPEFHYAWGAEAVWPGRRGSGLESARESSKLL